mmetsp:Transcript_5770/g.8391  ORF Transcript_5770/g.8391 Transcript_5770/m.8391 type:complete len:192 (+) Transcript_5770:103-678(+)
MLCVIRYSCGWVFYQLCFGHFPSRTSPQHRFDAILDVRTQNEWDSGHIPTATFVENLGSLLDIPQELEGCQGVCYTIVVYCASGFRANGAIDLLRGKGFQGTIYNGLGTNDWTQAGYELVTTPSVEGVCEKFQTAAKNLDDCVKMDPEVTTPPSPSPTTMPSSAADSGVNPFLTMMGKVVVAFSVCSLWLY